MSNWRMIIKDAQSIQNSDSLFVTCHQLTRATWPLNAWCWKRSTLWCPHLSLVASDGDFTWLQRGIHLKLGMRQKSSLDILLNVQGWYHLVG